MKRFLLPLLIGAGVTLAAPAHAQRDDGSRQERAQRFKPPSHLSRDERRQLREDVDAARGQYDERGHFSRERHRGRRLGPEEREQLRQDIQDANRDLRRR